MLDDHPVGDRPARLPQPAACPYLGLPDDPETRFSFADAAHRCRAKGKPVQVDLGHQGAHCLTPAYLDCQRFAGSPLGVAAAKASVAEAATSAAAASVAASAPAAEATIWPTTTPPPTEVLLTPVVAEVAVLPDGAMKTDTDTDTGTGRSGKDRVLRSLVGVLILAGLVLIAGALGSGSIRGFLGTADISTPTPTLLTAPTASPTAAPSPTPSASPSPTPSPTPTPTPTPTPVPSPSASPSPAIVIHVVARGESLSSIADQYGVAAKAIQLANKITNPSLIFVGQKLKIPPPP